MLEKNRVIHQGNAERNYHVFYQLLYATTDEELQKLCLLTREAHDYFFLSKGVATVDRIDDHAEYKDLCVSGIVLDYVLSILKPIRIRFKCVLLFATLLLLIVGSIF